MTNGRARVVTAGSTSSGRSRIAYSRIGLLQTVYSAGSVWTTKLDDVCEMPRNRLKRPNNDCGFAIDQPKRQPGSEKGYTSESYTVGYDLA